ncbi:MAG: UDP-glucose 4-epimerase GalE [Nitrospiraceae bacterium]|nr:UDP-glucose 4-epimerase GalE [Nitrospiraceae bacterium]
MSVLVTGGAGYIGSNAVEQLLAAGGQVVTLDNLSTGYREALSPQAHFIEGDIHDGALLRRIFADHDIDTVMHFAAFIVVSESCADPRKYIDNNVIGALSVLDAMIDSKVPNFILSSTAAVYGDPESVPLTEDMPKRPKNPYGLTKRMIEQTLEWYGEAYGLNYCLLRYFNAAGASATYGEAHVPETHLIPNILMAADGERDCITVFGDDYDTPDGTCVRDYIHVIDLAQAHIRAMQYLRNGGASEAFNLGNSVGHSNLEVIKAVERVSGKTVPLEFGERRPGDADRLVASSGKARAMLGWEPARGDIDVIVGDAWNWRKNHPGGYSRKPE